MKLGGYVKSAVDICKLIDDLKLAIVSFFFLVSGIHYNKITHVLKAMNTISAPPLLLFYIYITFHG